MALFGKKSKSTEIFIPDPEKANAWFNRARQMAESYNFESAFAYFACGFKLDPRDVSIHKEVLQIAETYHNNGGDEATNKQIKQVDGSTEIDKFVTALFVWWHDVMNVKNAMRAVSAAVDAEQNDFAAAMADTLLSLASKDSKTLTFKELKSLMELFLSAGAWNQAIKVGRAALAAKPDDAALERALNELAADRAMTDGGYDQIGTEEGGFKKFVKDIDKQRELEEDDSLAGSAGSAERVIARAKSELEENPNSPDAISAYVKVLKKHASPENSKLAFQVLMHGFKATKQYRFRMEAADIKISMAAYQIVQLEEKLASSPDEALQKKYDSSVAELRSFKKQEYQERASNYPTDRKIRFQLGELAIQDGDTNLAMECFQKAKDEPRLRVRAGQELGRCFASEGWYTEAASEFKESIKALAGSDNDTELSLRYDLMQSLAKKAEADDNIDLAKEAMDICSGIARKDISYRDIRDCRRELDALVKKLD